MNLIDKLRNRDRLNDEIINEVNRSEFGKHLESMADSKSYDLFIDLVGKELRHTRTSGPLYLKDVGFAECYDREHFKKHGQMIRLQLSVKYFDGEPDEFNGRITDYLLDVPFRLFESWSLKKMQTWAKNLTFKIRQEHIEYLQEEMKRIQKELNQLKSFKED